MESRTSCQGASKPEIFTLAPRGTTHGSILAGLLCTKQSDSLDSERLHALRRAPMMAATKKRRMIITETVMMMILTSRFSICDQEVAHVLDGLLQKCTKRVAAKSTEVPCNQSSGMGSSARKPHRRLFALANDATGGEADDDNCLHVMLLDLSLYPWRLTRQLAPLAWLQPNTWAGRCRQERAVSGRRVLNKRTLEQGPPP